MEYVIRFLAGGIVVSAFALLGDILRPKSFAGLFGAAPSVGLATLTLALLKQGGGDCLTLTGTGPATLRTTEPSFYILGAKSYGRNSHFLLKTGFEQVREAFTLITGKPDLDLYQPAK